jgi:succinate dehydrogenase/fumarate reductase cytochrome b subunit
MQALAARSSRAMSTATASAAARARRPLSPHLVRRRAVAARALAHRAALRASSSRPPPPHLPLAPQTIYKFRINMITSVIFRGTGIFLTGGLAAVSIATLPSSSPITDYVWHLQQYPLLSALTKFAIAGPLTYHLLGGLRHLVRAPACVGGSARSRVCGGRGGGAPVGDPVRGAPCAARCSAPLRSAHAP